MSENEKKSPIEVKGLGEKTVPEVEGLKDGKVDVTSTPTVAEAAPAEKVDITAMPSVTEAAQAEMDYK